MALDLCHPALRATIVCDKPTVDGHETINLLSTDRRLANQGFMTESFVRPPVTVVVSFPFNVEIQSVILNTKVGSQSSSGFEIWSFSERKKDTAPANELSAPQTLAFNDGTFMQVSKGCDTSKHFFAFVNNSYRGRPPYSELSPMTRKHLPEEDAVAERFLKYKGPGWLNLVSHLAIRIFKNSTGSTCAIRWLEIRGQPSSSCSIAIQRHILSIHQTIIKPPSDANPPHRAPHETKVEIKSPRNKDGTTVLDPAEIPDDFLDPIMCEIMALPVLLPSANTIDQSTLDRHINEEAKWGRPPNDPFTGVPFSEKHKPIPNAALKSRIDAFLLGAGTNFSTIARTVGTGLMIGTTVSRLIDTTKSDTGQNDSASAFGGKSPFTAGSSTRKRNSFSCDSSQTYCNTAKRTCADKVLKNANDGLETAKVLSVGVPKSHADRLRTSLQRDIDSTLSSLPSFIRFTTRPSTATKVSEGNAEEDWQDGKCVTCRAIKEMSDTYKLRCSHTICRDCLITAKTFSVDLGAVYGCSMCKNQTASKDIVKLQGKLSK